MNKLKIILATIIAMAFIGWPCEDHGVHGGWFYQLVVWIAEIM